MTNQIITSFPCPKCEEGNLRRSWVLLKKDGTFLCPRCGSTYSSHESAWPENN